MMPMTRYPTNQDQKELNILLLGQSGVGKSTFINACLNYLKYRTLQDLLQNDLHHGIPARFDIIDRNFQEHIVQIGCNDDQNEVLLAGRSGTQNAKTYVFPLDIQGVPFKIRFLDTPGMGDQRGPEQDQLNCERILAHISHQKEIHAFCILLKPDNPRLDIFLQYCILQILSRLDSTAVKNIIFVFTNTRGENFTPGKTYRPLKILLEEIEKQNNFSVPVSSHNTFCFDNESFRYAAAIKNGVQFNDDVFKSTETSWCQSCTEFWRLIMYVHHLPPHDLKRTISINEARGMASNLTQPATEIVQVIQDNIKKLNEHCQLLNEAKLTRDEFIRLMYTPVIDIKIEAFSQPVTVCTHPQCTSVYRVNGINKLHFKQKCCQGCLVTFVTPEIIGNPALYVCSAFNWLSNCKVCKHGLEHHQHIYYGTEMYERRCDESVASALSDQIENIQTKEEFLGHLRERQREFEHEKDFILESCAMFDRYLRNNSIANIGNTIKDYLKHQITRENAYGVNRSQATIDQLGRLLADYERIYSSTNENYSAQQIENRRNALLHMKHFGARINGLYTLQQRGVMQTIQNSETVFPVQQMDWFTGIQNVIALGSMALELGRSFFTRP